MTDRNANGEKGRLWSKASEIPNRHAAQLERELETATRLTWRSSLLCTTSCGKRQESHVVNNRHRLRHRCRHRQRATQTKMQAQTQSHTDTDAGTDTEPHTHRLPNLTDLSSMLRGGVALLGSGPHPSQDGSDPEHGEGLTERIGGGVRHTDASSLAVCLNVLLLTWNAYKTSIQRLVMPSCALLAVLCC